MLSSPTTVGCLILQGFVYVYDGINTDDSLSYEASFCGAVHDDPLLNSVDIYSGYATVVYHGNSTGKFLLQLQHIFGWFLLLELVSDGTMLYK